VREKGLETILCSWTRPGQISPFPSDPVERGNAQTKNMDFIKKVGKINIPTFYESSRYLALAWVHKLDTYFKLNPMTESKDISFTTLYLDGEAHEW
jgi:hypothetical protein